MVKSFHLRIDSELNTLSSFLGPPPREAFTQLISYKLARQGTEEGEFIIYFKSLRNDVLNQFILFELEKDEKKKDEKSSETQMSLFLKK